MEIPIKLPQNKDLEDKIRRIIQKYFSNSPIISTQLLRFQSFGLGSKIEPTVQQPY
jgi:hypothetical protein